MKDEIKGYWWLPEQTDRKIAGLLYTSDDGTHLLDLFGNFEGMPFLASNNKYIIINGVSSKGIRYTLVDSFIKSQTGSMPGFTVTTILVNIIFKNILIGKKDELLFTSMRASFLYLDDWIIINGFNYYDNMKSKATIDYNLPEPIKYNVNDEFYLTINFTASPPAHQIHPKELSIKQNVEIKIDGMENSLDWYLEKVQIFKFLLMLFTNSYTRSIYLKGEYSKGSNDDLVLISFKEDAELVYKKDLVFTELLCSFPNIKEIFQDILCKWYKQHSLLSSSHTLFFETMYKSGLNLENKYLNIVHALESYHRNSSIYVSGYMDKEEYKKEIYPKMVKSIPNELESDFKDGLKARIKFGYEYSLRRRIKELFKSNNNFLNNFIVDAETLQKEIVDTRNYYTHYDEKSDFVKENMELYQLLEKIRVIFFSLFLFDLGFEYDKVKDMIENQEYIQRFINVSGFKRPWDHNSNGKTENVKNDK
jgi:hypothetical protein